MGKYHPHGDAAIYDALVRMAQDFSLRYPLVDGHGNFGSLDGDAAGGDALHRGRLRRARRASCSTSSARSTVDCRPNYDGTTLRADRAAGAVPAAAGQRHAPASRSAWRRTSRRTTWARSSTRCVALIDDPKLETKDLLKYVKGPDFPTGGAGARTRRRSCARSTRPGRARSSCAASGRARGAQARRPADRHHLDPLRGEQGDAGREDRRGRPRAEAAAARRRARRVDRRTCASCSSSSGTPTRAGDGVPLQAHAAADELPRQPDLPGADRQPGGRRAAAARPARRCSGTSSTSASRW